MTRKITATQHKNVAVLEVPDRLTTLTSEEISDAIRVLQVAQAGIHMYEFGQRVVEAEAAGAGEVEARVMAMTGMSREQLAELGGLSEDT